MTSAAFVAALKPQLETRFAATAGLEQVAVHLYEVDVSAPAVVLVRSRVRHEQDYSRAAMGPLTNEDVTIPGLIGTRGDLQDAADQAAQIIAAIRLELRTNPPQVGGRTLDARVDNIGWQPFPADGGGVICDTEFDIVYTSSDT